MTWADHWGVVGMIDLVLGVLGTLFGMLAVSILLFMLYIIFDKD